MPTPVDIFGSPGAQSVIARMTPDKGAPTGSRRIAPTNTLAVDLRISESESVQQWFRRVIGNDDIEQRIEQCAVADDCAFFGEISWANDAIHYCRFQVLITVGMTLSQFYSQASESLFYYRLETDLSALGQLFSHPQPHLHTLPKDAPRFPFIARNNEFILISFLEFIFLNHFYNSWLKWAENKGTTRISREAFEDIVFSFEGSKTRHIVQDLGSEIAELKSALREAKEAEVPNPLTMLPTCQVLTYL